MSPSHKLITQLERFVPGSFSLNGDARYAAAVNIWPDTAVRPAAIVHCANAEHARMALMAAHDAQLPVSVRGGGHDWNGRALCDGVVIDLTPMRSVSLKADRSAVEVGGGCRGIDLFAVTDPIGAAAMTGSSGVVGLSGLTLGGGYGALTPRFGLACDGLEQAEVVLADGTIVRASEAGDADLLWALRGGGGNFGVVTTMQLALHHVPTVYSGLIGYPFSQAAQVIDKLADFMASAPEALDVQIVMTSAPDGQLVVLIAPTWSGAPKDGELHVEPLRRLGTPLMENVQHSAYGVSRSVHDSFTVNGRRTLMATRWVSRLAGEVAATLVDRLAHRPTSGCSVVTHDLRGAATRVDPAATAFGCRAPHTLIEIIAQSDAALDDQPDDARWVQQTAAAIDRFSLAGGYANLLTSEDRARACDSFGPNAARLIAAKRRYDPQTVFRSTLPLPIASL
jgi:FAD/FMN-containing dehydrogenase